MLRKWFYLILVASVIVAFVFSACKKKNPTQSNPPRPIWVTYNTSNSGLAEYHVFGIAIDASRNKWFGTKGGVSKFRNINHFGHSVTKKGTRLIL
jgi:hypothetical protein